MPATTASHNDADDDDDNETDEWLELQELEAELAHSGGGGSAVAAAAAGRGRSSGGQYVSIASTDDVGDNDEEKLLSSRNGSSHATRKERLRRQSQDSDDEDDDGSKSALNMVKTVVAETDDPSLPNITFRVLLLGTILCAIGAAISQLFFVRDKRILNGALPSDAALPRCFSSNQSQSGCLSRYSSLLMALLQLSLILQLSDHPHFLPCGTLAGSDHA